MKLFFFVCIFLVAFWASNSAPIPVECSEDTVKVPGCVCGLFNMPPSCDWASLDKESKPTESNDDTTVEMQQDSMSFTSK